MKTERTENLHFPDFESEKEITCANWSAAVKDEETKWNEVFFGFSTWCLISMKFHIEGKD